jgi:hypothetical protein
MGGRSVIGESELKSPDIAARAGYSSTFLNDDK